MNSTVAAELDLNPSRNRRQTFRYAHLAGKSISACIPLLLAGRPRTPLRLLCIGAFDYLARVQGKDLRNIDRLALAYACDFGALRNDFYDQGELDRTDYREIRHSLRRLAPECATRRYIHALRDAERGRPAIGIDCYVGSAAVAQYRTQVLFISLTWLEVISSSPLPPHFFKVLVSLAGLAQLVDDLLDCKDDWECRRPTFVTAFFRERVQLSGEAITHIHSYANRFRNLLVATSERHREVAPLALAGEGMWLLALALLKLRFRR